MLHDSTDLFIEPKLLALAIRYLKRMGITVKALAIFLCPGDSTFAPSGWFMHTWSHLTINCIVYVLLCQFHNYLYLCHFYVGVRSRT